MLFFIAYVHRIVWLIFVVESLRYLGHTETPWMRKAVRQVLEHLWSFHNDPPQPQTFSYCEPIIFLNITLCIVSSFHERIRKESNDSKQHKTRQRNDKGWLPICASGEMPAGLSWIIHLAVSMATDEPECISSF